MDTLRVQEWFDRQTPDMLDLLNRREFYYWTCYMRAAFPVLNIVDCKRILDGFRDHGLLTEGR